MPVDTSKMTAIPDIPSGRFEYADELLALSREAQDFLASQKWCRRIAEGWLDRGWGYIVGVFYFAIEPSHEEAPSSVWIIVGDLPPACIDAQDNPNGACGLDAYVREMQRWVDNVLDAQPVEYLIPVNVPPTEAYAKMLQSRLRIIREEILAYCREELQDSEEEIVD